MFEKRYQNLKYSNTGTCLLKMLKQTFPQMGQIIINVKPKQNGNLSLNVMKNPLHKNMLLARKADH